MKKYLGFMMIAVLAVTALATHVRAETYAPNSIGKMESSYEGDSQNRVEKMKELRDKMMAQKQKQDNRSLMGRLMPMKFGDKSIEDGLSKKDIVGLRFGFVNHALDNIYTRLSNVITKLTEAGKDTTLAKADLAIAKTKIDAAHLAITELETLVASIKNATITATATGAKPVISSADMLKIRAAAAKAKTAAQEAKTALKKVHQDIEVLVGDNDDEEEENDN